MLWHLSPPTHVIPPPKKEKIIEWRGIGEDIQPELVVSTCTHTHMHTYWYIYATHKHMPITRIYKQHQKKKGRRKKKSQVLWDMTVISILKR